MPLAAFEPATPASERPQTHALDHAATGIGKLENYTFFSLDQHQESDQFFSSRSFLLAIP